MKVGLLGMRFTGSLILPVIVLLLLIEQAHAAGPYSYGTKLSYQKYKRRIQDASLFPGRRKGGLRIDYQDLGDFSNLPSLIKHEGFLGLGLICIKRGAFILYRKKYFGAEQSEDVDVASGDNRCFNPVGVQSMQPLGPIHLPGRDSITFFGKPNFASIARGTTQSIIRPFFNPMQSTVKSLILVGYTNWTISTGKGKKYCLRSQPMEKTEKSVVCLLPDFTVTKIGQAGVNLMKVSRGCQAAGEDGKPENVIDITFCRYWGSVPKVQEGKGLIEDSSSGGALGGRTGSGGCRGEEQSQAFQDSIKLFGAVLTNAFDSNLVLEWKDLGKMKWKLELLDTIFDIAKSIVPDAMISDSYMNRIRELFVFQLSKVWAPTGGEKIEGRRAFGIPFWLRQYLRPSTGHLTKDIKFAGQFSKEMKYPGQFTKDIKHPGQLTKDIKHPGQLTKDIKHPGQLTKDIKHPGQLTKDIKHPGQLTKDIKHPGQHVKDAQDPDDTQNAGDLTKDIKPPSEPAPESAEDTPEVTEEPPEEDARRKKRSPDEEESPPPPAEEPAPGMDATRIAPSEASEYQTQLKEYDYRGLLFQTEKCLQLTYLKGGEGKTSTILGAWLGITDPLDVDKLIWTGMRFQKDANVVLEMTWLVFNMVGGLCHKLFKYAHNYWAVYIHIVSDLYLKPVVPLWKTQIPDLDIILGGNMYMKYNKLAIAASMSLFAAGPNSMEPFSRPAGVSVVLPMVDEGSFPTESIIPPETTQEPLVPSGEPPAEPDSPPAPAQEESKPAPHPPPKPDSHPPSKPDSHPPPKPDSHPPPKPDSHPPPKPADSPAPHKPEKPEGPEPEFKNDFDEED